LAQYAVLSHSLLVFEIIVPLIRVSLSRLASLSERPVALQIKLLDLLS
jgi:hypothetical protein